MSTLYLAWQDRRDYSWFPVGRMTRRTTEPVGYEFEYIRGAEKAKQYARPFEVPLPGWPDLWRSYRAPSVFPAFRYRAMNPGRPDRPEYLQMLGLDADSSEVIDELAVSGGNSLADSFETFPSIEPDSDGIFSVRFIVHGLRAVRHYATDRVNELIPDEHLVLSVMPDGPYGGTSLGVRTDDNKLVGWLPRYLVDVLFDEHGERASDLELRVVQVNHKAPLDHRLLVELTGKFPPGVDPMSELEMYQPISIN